MGVCNTKNSINVEVEVNGGKMKKSESKKKKKRKKESKTNQQIENRKKVEEDKMITNTSEVRKIDIISEDMKKEGHNEELLKTGETEELKVKNDVGQKGGSKNEKVEVESEESSIEPSEPFDHGDPEIEQKIKFSIKELSKEETISEKPKFLVILSEKKEDIEEETNEIEKVLQFFSSRIQDIEKNVVREEEIIESLYNMGLAFSKSESDEKAIEYYDKAIFESKKNSNHSYDQISFEKGISYGHVGEFEKSLENFDEAIRIDEKNFTSIFNRAVTKTKIAISFMHGDEEDTKQSESFLNEALRDYDEAIRLCLCFEEAIYNRSMVYLHGFKNYEKCTDDLIQLLDQTYRKSIRQSNETQNNNTEEMEHLEFITRDYLEHHIPIDVSSINRQIVLICKTSKLFRKYPSDSKYSENKDAIIVENLLLIRSLLKCILGDYRSAISDFRVASRLRNELPGVRNHYHSVILKTFLGETTKRTTTTTTEKEEEEEEGEEEERESQDEQDNRTMIESKLVDFSSVFPYGLSNNDDRKISVIEKYLGTYRVYSECQHRFSTKSFSDFEVYQKIPNNFQSMNFHPSQGMTSCEYIVRIKDDEDHLITSSSQISYRMNVLVQHGFGEEEMKTIIERGKNAREDFGNALSLQPGTMDMYPIYSRISQVEDYEKLEKFPLEEIDEEEKTIIAFFWNYEGGRCLKNLILEREKVKEVSFTELEVLIILREILRSVCSIHDKKMVHRNISEDTVFLDDDFGRLMLGCFGDCLFVSEYCEDEFQFVPDRYFNKGSNVSVLAPEIVECVLNGRNPIDYSKNDVFSVGLIGHRMLNRGGAGGTPFVGKKMMQSMYQDLSVKYSERIREFIKKMLWVDADQRLGCHEALRVCEDIVNERICK